MWIQSIKLTHYRNYLEAHVDFSAGLNIFLGPNAQGKTNFLEAIYFLSLTRSHRTRNDRELIHFENNTCQISGILNRQTGSIPLDITLTDKGRTSKINHLKQAKLSDYIGTMTVVLFAPEDLQLVKGAPALRRKFMDIDLGQIKPLYLTDLSQYNHILKQRNTYLKTAKQIDLDFLSVLDDQLADYGSRVIQQRLDFVENLIKEANKHHNILSNKEEHLSACYKSSVTFTYEEDIHSNFLADLHHNRDSDILRKNTSVGPHRDDLTFAINEVDAKFSSQGQQRSLILSLKMAEVNLIKQITGDSPILLLDDVMSELDNFRQEKLLENVQSQNIQTFITTTSLEHLKNLPEELSIFQVKQGHIKISKKE